METKSPAKAGFFVGTNVTGNGFPCHSALDRRQVIRSFDGFRAIRGITIRT